jgi:two-component system sensor histidine kinase AlgZ
MLKAICGEESRYWLRILGIGVVITIVATVVFGELGSMRSVLVSFAHSVIYAFCTVGLVGGVMPWLVPRLAAQPLAVKWLLVVTALLVMAVGGTALAAGLITVLGLGSKVPFTARFLANLRTVSLIAVGLGIGMTLYETLRHRLEKTTAELRAQELEQERTRKLALEAQLSSLESRLQPHFLFNTLNAISALIQQDPERAERTVERLAALLRASLDATGRGTVPLAREMEIVADYLEIEQTRFGPRLSCALDVAPEVAGCDVLPLSIQTLVENSVKHAVAPRRTGGRLGVTARVEDSRLTIEVWDDGPGFSLDTLPPGHGLDTLSRRLAVRFGPAATLKVGRRDGGTLVTLSLPRTVAAVSAP